MRLLILLLSDIHFTTSNNKVANLSTDIASSLYPQIREADKCVIVITGDITNGGSPDEFNIAADFFFDIKEKLELESGKTVEIISVPGNHDCLLIPENTIRTKIIEGIKKEADAKDQQVIDICTSVQSNYFTFRACTTSIKPIYEDKLWVEYELDLEGNKIRFSALNASWMSQIHEKPGTLVFPIENYNSILKQPSLARFVLLHHPLNWYTQSSYHPLKSAIRSAATAILSGHEHSGGSGIIVDNTSGASIFFEAPALQPSSNNRELESGYVSLCFNFTEQKVIESKFRIENYQKISIQEVNIQSIESITSPIPDWEDITSEFQNKLRDPGADFKSEFENELTIDDFYVYPEIQALTGKDDSFSIQDSEDLLTEDPHGKKILFLGESSSGKTTLLYQAFKCYRKLGYYPILLNAAELKNSTELEITKIISKSQVAQYINPEVFGTLPKDKMIILVDDIDRLRDGLKALPKLIQYLQIHYSGIILSAVSGFEFGELLDAEAQEATKEFTSYRIRFLGQWLKHRLIRKWCICTSAVGTAKALESKVHAVEKTLNLILGKNLVPGVPIYILILLQSIEKQQESALTDSHIGSYYGYMIDRSLREAGIKPNKLVEMKGYLSELAWFFKSSNIRECSIAEITAFNRTYSDVQNTVDLNQRLNLLANARMLIQREEYYSFNYPYIYYYFLGQYIAKHLNKNLELKELVSTWCASLQKHDNANCILFIAHHVNDEWIIDRVSEELDKCFEGKPNICFNGDIDSVNQLVQKTSTLIMEAPNVEKLREERLKSTDKHDNKIITVNEKDNDTSSDIAVLINDINKTFITSRILGQILKGYYGDIRRGDREVLVNRIFSSQLRFLYHFISTLLQDPTALVSTIESGLEPMDGQSKEDRIKEIRQNIYQFLGILCTVTIQGTAENVSSDDLREDVNVVTNSNGTNAYRLIRAATSLIRPNALPFEELSKLSSDTEDNPFAFTILQSLAAHHMRSFHLKDSDRQRLCSTTKIQLLATKPSEKLTETIKPAIKTR